MSGIFGIIARDGTPIDETVFQALGRHVAAPFGGAFKTYRAKGVALGQVGSELPAESPAGIAVCDARIDNLNELRTRLGTESSSVLSGEFLASYEKWGRDACTSMFGDFAFAVYDSTSRTLVLCVDVFATRPLYFHVGKAWIVFASTPDAFRYVPHVPLDPDLYRVADYLVPALEWSTSRRTFFRAVKRVPPAHVVSIATDATVREYRWWKAEPGTPHRFRSAEEMGESLRPLIVEAIRSRASQAKHPGLLLSGGLDSGTLLGASRAAGATLHTFSGIERDETKCPDARYVRDVLQQHEGPSEILTPDMPGLMGSHIDTLLSNCDALFVFGQAGLRTSLFAHAGTKGVDVVMTGVGPDECMGLPLFAPSWLLRRARLRQSLRTLRSYHRSYGGSKRSVLFHRLLRPAVPFPIRRIIRSLRSVRASRIGHLISKGLATQTRVRERLAEAYPIQPIASAGECIARVLNDGDFPCAFERYAQMARPFGVVPTHPYVDRRIVDWALGLDASAWSLLPHVKAPLAAAAKPWVPESVRTRAQDGNPDFETTLYANRIEWMTGLVESARGSGWVKNEHSASRLESPEYWNVSTLESWRLLHWESSGPILC